MMIAAVLYRALRIAATAAIVVALVAYITVMWSHTVAWWAAVWTVVAVVLALGAWFWVQVRLDRMSR